MGTNYYLHKNVCPHCKKADEVLHIGKSSKGWAFGLHVILDNGIYDLDNWKAQFKAENTEIRNEYGDIISPDHMLSIILDRRNEAPTMTYEEAKRNHAVNDPINNLLRICNQNPVFIGRTYDICDYEFS